MTQSPSYNTAREIAPSDAFIRRTRNPDLVRVMPRETPKEIAKRIMGGVKPQPVVERAMPSARAATPSEPSLLRVSGIAGIAIAGRGR